MFYVVIASSRQILLNINDCNSVRLAGSMDFLLNMGTESDLEPGIFYIHNVSYETWG
jgi:hypothetical protein